MSCASTRPSACGNSTCSSGSTAVSCLTIWIASATEIISCVLYIFCAQKTERPVLDRPLKVGGGIQPQLVTVLTPATTFTVGEDFSQKTRGVNSRRLFFDL